MTQGEDSERELWQDDSRGSDFWRQVISDDGDARVDVSPNSRSSSALGRSPRKGSRSKHVAEKGVETEDAPVRSASVTRTSKHSSAAPRSRVRKIQPTTNVSSSHVGYRQVVQEPQEHEDYFTAIDSDADRVEVETMIDTDTEPSAPPTRQTSFTFSQTSRISDTSSSSSVISRASLAGSTASRKRTLEYGDVRSGTASPTSPSPKEKSRKKTRQHNTTASSTRSPEMSQHSSLPALHFPLATSTTDGRGRNRTSSSPSPVKRAMSTVSTVIPRAELSFMQSTGSSTSASLGRRSSTRTVDLPELVPSASSGVLASKTITAAEGLMIISHSKVVQALMDHMQISWGVQYEIARGVCHGHWTWDDVTASALERLKGSNQEAAGRVIQVMLSHDVSKAPEMDSILWTELDREQEALLTDPSRGLGLKGEWHEVPNWYGGCIQQIGRLVKMEKGSVIPYTIRLERMLKRKSNRFARFLGSRRMLQVSVPEELAREREVDSVRRFFSQKFVLCGRVFVPFAAKERKVFMMETNEDFERSPDPLGDRRRISLEAFVEWHNPLALNSSQPTSKWITRYDLGLSTSVPVLQFKGVDIDIFYIEDEVAPYNQSLGKAPTENIFTDGCGFMNGAALTLIGKEIGYSERPTVVQGRFAGSKGLWALHPEDRSPNAPPRIWIRPSQQKIKYHELGPAQLIFDLVAPPRVTVPSRLSKYTIMNLSHNGVPDEVFVTLMRDGLQKEIDALTTWSSPQDLLLLWNTVNRAGSVTMSKLRQQASSGARVLGFGRAQDREDLEDDDDDDGPENIEELLGERDRLEYGGEPTSLHSSVMELLQAGFHPLKLEILYAKLRDVVKKRIEDFIKEYRIVLPQSAEAFIIPDPLGVLEEGQIHFRATQNLKDPMEDASPTIITGPVLIYRNPARVPSDVQKVTAIAHPALAEYLNVIILPVKGHRSLANLLAGGDVDGDVCVCIYDPALVGHFRNPKTNDPLPGFQGKHFEPVASIEKVSDLNRRLQSIPATDKQVELQKVLVSGLSDPPVGLYSLFHENAAYALGYDHSETLRTAFMFTTVLDSRKTGQKVKADIFKQHKRKYLHDKPACMDTKDSQFQYGKDSNGLPPQRRNLPPFVLDQLLQAGKDMQSQHLARFDDLRLNLVTGRDSDLCQPYQDAMELAKDLKERGSSDIMVEIELIKEHIEKHIRDYNSLSARSPSKSTPSKARGKSNAKADRNREYQELAESFARGSRGISLLSHLPCSLERIIASGAYHSNAKFAFRVAFRSLCKIKADAVGSIALSANFAEVMSIPSSATRIFTQAR